MERIVEQGFLYDFYGELLTEHQRLIYEDFVLNNLSLSEIAQEQGVSRQGIHDIVKRCDKVLADYEQKLHLVEKFQNARKMTENLQKMIANLQQSIGKEMPDDGQYVRKLHIQLGEMERTVKELLENL